MFGYRTTSRLKSRLCGCDCSWIRGAAALPAPAQTLTILYTFNGSPDGAYPHSPLVRDAAGNLYGNTFQGGSFGFGTIFE
jgi:hypothetical protein